MLNSSARRLLVSRQAKQAAESVPGTTTHDQHECSYHQPGIADRQLVPRSKSSYFRTRQIRVDTAEEYFRFQKLFWLNVRDFCRCPIPAGLRNQARRRSRETIFYFDSDDAFTQQHRPRNVLCFEYIRICDEY